MITRSVRHGSEELVYQVKRSRRRRTVTLRIDPSGALTVYAPHYIWGPFLDRFVRKHWAWIVKKRAELKNRAPVPVLSEAERERLWEETARRLPAVVQAFAERLQVPVRTVRVANQNTRWGSCSAAGELRFSWRMGPLPEMLFEYVVVHELAHLKEMNHSPRFWAVVESVLPDYRARRKALRQADYFVQN